jgi:hypothetical protein
MRALTIFTLAAGITTASVFGLHHAGALTPVLDKAEHIAVVAGVIQKSPCNIVVGLDITSGREGELVKDKKAIEKMIRNLGPGDKLSVYLIHSRAESEQEAIFNVDLPETIGPMGQVLQRAKAAADKEWSVCWQDKVMPLVRSDEAKLKQRTDLFGFLRFIAHQKSEFLKEKKAWIVLFTDGQHVGDGFNMEKRAPQDRDLDKAEQSDFIPPLHNVRLAFVGMTPTHGISNEHWRKLQTFWKNYGNISGAKCTSVSSGRDLNVQ